MNRAFAALVVLVCTWVAHADPAVVAYDVSARTMMTARSPLPGDLATVLTSDLELDPAAVGSIIWSRASLSLRYNPQLILREPQLQPRVLPLHEGQLLFQKTFERASLALQQDGAYGVTDVGSARLPQGARPGGVSEVPNLGPVPYVRSASFLSLQFQPTGFVTYSLSGGYLISGDPNRSIQMPLQQGPAGNTSLRIVLNRRLRLVTDGLASHANFSTGAEQSIMLGTQSVEWQLARTTVLSLGAGAAVTRERVVQVPNGPPPGFYLEALPVLIGSLVAAPEARGVPVQLNAGLRMAPFADRFTGLIYERFEASLSANARPRRELMLTSSAGAGYALGLGQTSQPGDTALFAEVGGAWELYPWLSLVGTGRIVWTAQPRLGTSAALWALSIGATVRERDRTSW